MLFRRISEHVKAQNWTAVALDFVIVVAGILIAFQITNWSEARSDRVRERQIIVRVHSDFEALGREVDEKIEFMESVTDVIEEFKQLLVDAPEDADLQRLKIFYETAFTLPSISGQSDTYLQLVSSGDMSLLTDEQVRAGLVAHASMTTQFLHQDQAIREWSRPYITPIVRLRSLIDAMPLGEAIDAAGSKADVIVAIDMYQNLFQSQLSVQQTHKESFTKVTEMLAEEKN